MLAVLAALLLAGCGTAAPPSASAPPDLTAVAQAVDQTLVAPRLPTFTLAPALPQQPARTPAPVTPTPQPEPSATAAPLPDWYEPAGCLRPPGDLTPVEINGWTINARTLAMLRHAQELYGGAIDLTGAALTQGSYHDNGSASFGTHMGGGAVDLAIFIPGTWTIDYAELQRLVRSLRAAGFAAWVRNIDEVYPGSGYHIHAIAVGDPQLSQAAEEQLTGRYGYFYGWNGLPKPDGVPAADREGGPVLCGWMVEAGYSDWSAAANPPPAFPPAGWEQRLANAADGMQTGSQEASVALARSLYYFDGQSEQPDTLDGPLAGALWERAGLLPAGLHPARRPASYRPNAGRMNALATSLPAADYERLAGDASWQPLPGDLVELRGDAGSHMLVITGRDADGRSYTVTPLQGPDGAWLVQRALFHDPAAPAEGLLGQWREQGFNTVDVLRYRWGGLPETLPLAYTVQPGDRLPDLAARMRVPVEAIIVANPGVNPAALVVGEVLVIPGE